jgi:ketosteroid isomerase-like protein
MFAFWAALDLEGMLGIVDPGLEWRAAADGQLYRGHEGVREFFRRHSNGERLEVPLQRAVEVRPGCVLAVGRLRIQRPGRGLADSPGIWLFYVSDGKIGRIESYRSEREALDAAQAPDPVVSLRS